MEARAIAGVLTLLNQEVKSCALDILRPPPKGGKGALKCGFSVQHDWSAENDAKKLNSFTCRVNAEFVGYEEDGPKDGEELFKLTGQFVSRFNVEGGALTAGDIRAHLWFVNCILFTAATTYLNNALQSTVFAKMTLPINFGWTTSEKEAAAD